MCFDFSQTPQMKAIKFYRWWILPSTLRAKSMICRILMIEMNVALKILHSRRSCKMMVKGFRNCLLRYLRRDLANSYHRKRMNKKQLQDNLSQIWKRIKIMTSFNPRAKVRSMSKLTISAVEWTENRILRRISSL